MRAYVSRIQVYELRKRRRASSSHSVTRVWLSTTNVCTCIHVWCTSRSRGYSIIEKFEGSRLLNESSYFSKASLKYGKFHVKNACFKRSCVCTLLYFKEWDNWTHALFSAFSFPFDYYYFFFYCLHTLAFVSIVHFFSYECIFLCLL